MRSDPVRVPVSGPLDAASYDGLIRRLQSEAGPGTVLLDLERTGGLDTLGAARLLRLVGEARGRGLDVRLANLPEGTRRLLDEIDPSILDVDAVAKRRPVLEQIGGRTLDVADSGRELGRLLADTAVGVSRPFGRRGIPWGRTLEQMALVGSNAVPIVVFISCLIGVVLALNGAQQLRQFGAGIFIANLVGISMTREMGPLVTAVIVAGRTGSAIAAEIGTMVVSEEIDAMRTMALSPVRFLVVPKIVALALMVPLLTVLAIAAGIAGGYAVGVFALDLGSNAYLSQTVKSLFVADVATGLVKSVVFAVIIGLEGARRGFSVHGGPDAVGRATTAAVVTSIILCIVANAVFTTIFYVAE